MDCLVCKKEVVSNSNYCQEHKPKWRPYNKKYNHDKYTIQTLKDSLNRSESYADKLYEKIKKLKQAPENSKKTNFEERLEKIELLLLKLHEKIEHLEKNETH